MIAHPVGPGSGEEEKIRDVFKLVHVRRLVVDAVDAADHSVVSERHLIGNVDRRMLCLAPNEQRWRRLNSNV